MWKDNVNFVGSLTQVGLHVLESISQVTSKKYFCICTHLQEVVAAKHLRREIAKNNTTRQNVETFVANAAQEYDDHSHHINANVTQTSTTEDRAKDSSLPSFFLTK